MSLKSEASKDSAKKTKMEFFATIAIIYAGTKTHEKYRLNFSF